MMWFEARAQILNELAAKRGMSKFIELMKEQGYEEPNDFREFPDQIQKEFEENLDKVLLSWFTLKMEEAPHGDVTYLATVAIAYDDIERFWKQIHDGQRQAKGGIDTYRNKLIEQAINEMRKPDLRLIQGGLMEIDPITGERNENYESQVDSPEGLEHE